jgi:hypothetical protein
MTVEVSERSFEKTIECGLLQYGPDACSGEVTGVRETAAPYGEFPPGGYRKRPPEEYERSLTILRQELYSLLYKTSISPLLTFIKDNI